MSYFIDLSLLRRNRDFALLYTGQFISFVGGMITAVAMPYQIYHETRSTLLVGLLSLFMLLPLLVTALLGGVFSDRYDRRRLILITEAFLAVGCLMLAWNADLTAPHVLTIFVVASAVSLVNGLHRPAIDGMTQQLVHSQDYPAMSALSSFRYSMGTIGGSAIAGLIIAHLGVVVTYLIDFASFIICMITIILIKNIPKLPESPVESVWASLKTGLNYAFSRQELLGSYAVDFTAMIFGMPNALFPAIAFTFGGVKTLGLLYAAPAVGALLMSIVSGWTRHVKRHGLAIAIAASLWGVAIVGFGLSEHLGEALFFLVCAGLFDEVSAVFRGILWNETIPHGLRGRLAGIEMISYLGGPRLGNAEAGLVASAFGVTASIISGGLLCVVGVAVCCYFLPRFCQYRSGQLALVARSLL